MNDNNAIVQKKEPSKVLATLKYILANYNYIITFLVIFIAFLAINGDSTTWKSVTNIFLHSAILGSVALGMGFVILTGDIDLSVGSSFVLVGGLAILVFNMSGSIMLMLISALVFGGICGLINGFLVGKVGMPSFIVTLASMLVFRSISQYMMNELGETRYRIDASLPSYKALFEIGNGEILTIPNIAIVFLIVAGISIYVTLWTKYGKQVYAIGSNEKAAKLGGINVVASRIMVFVISGLFVGLAAFLKIAKDTSFDPATSGRSFELYAIAAVVIGGISMAGGKGKISGIIFGTMSFTLIDKIITALGMNALLNDSVKGLILLTAVGLQMTRKKNK